MKRALSVLAGLVAGVITVGIVESLGHLIWPPPEGVDITDPEALAGIMDSIPTEALISVLVAWILGALVGGFVAKKVDKGQGMMPSIITGALLTAFGVWTMFTIPHPTWMWIFGVLTPIPAAYLGAVLASKPGAPAQV